MRRIVIYIDPKDGMITDFRYDGEQEPPPIIHPKIKKHHPKDNDDKKKEEKPS